MLVSGSCCQRLTCAQLAVRLRPTSSSASGWHKSAFFYPPPLNSWYRPPLVFEYRCRKGFLGRFPFVSVLSPAAWWREDVGGKRRAEAAMTARAPSAEAGRRAGELVWRRAAPYELPRSPPRPPWRQCPPVPQCRRLSGDAGRRFRRGGRGALGSGERVVSEVALLLPGGLGRRQDGGGAAVAAALSGVWVLRGEGGKGRQTPASRPRCELPCPSPPPGEIAGGCGEGWGFTARGCVAACRPRCVCCVCAVLWTRSPVSVSLLFRISLPDKTGVTWS